MSLLAVVGCVSDSPLVNFQVDASAPDTSASTPDTSIADTSAPDASPSATIKLTPAMPTLRQGSTLMVQVDIARNGLTGPIALVASGAQMGTTVTMPAIADGTTTVQMTITTDPKAVVGSAPITLKATGVIDFTFTLVVQGPSGSLDTSFNQSGIITDTSTPSGIFNAVAAQPDGKLVVVGVNASSGWIIRHYNVDGSDDVSFNTNAAAIRPTTGAGRGIAFDPKKGPDRARRRNQLRDAHGHSAPVRRQPRSGLQQQRPQHHLADRFWRWRLGRKRRVRVAGLEHRRRRSGARAAKTSFIRRRLPNGGLDTSFGTTGELDYADSNINAMYYIFFRGLTVMPDGRVVAVGNRSNSSAGPVIYRVWP